MRKLFSSALLLFIGAILVTPVMAIGPTNAEGKNPWVQNALGGTNTQMWLDSGVMNEWINNPVLPNPVRVTTKDASKFQIKNAILVEDASVPSILSVITTENQWFHLTKPVFTAMLVFLGAEPSVAEPYDDGVYLKANAVGLVPE